MRYQFTNEEVKRGDFCILVWYASHYGKLVDDCPIGKKGETTYGEWHEFDNNNESCMIPVVVEEVNEEYVSIRPYKINKDGRCSLIYTENHPEPVSIQFRNDDEVFTRLIKSNWDK